MRIANGGVNGDLAGFSILKLETDTIFSSADSPAEASARIESVIDEVIASKSKTILFVDELTNVIEAGTAGTKLIENISNGKLRIIGGSSKAAFSEKIEKNAELERLFAGIVIVGKDSSEASASNISSLIRKAIAVTTSPAISAR